MTHGANVIVTRASDVDDVLVKRQSRASLLAAYTTTCSKITWINWTEMAAITVTVTVTGQLLQTTALFTAKGHSRSSAA